MKYIFLLFLLMGCDIDLEGLQSGLCGSQKIKCPTNQYCNNGICSNIPPIIDMSVPKNFNTIDECVSYYFPYSNSSWYTTQGSYWNNRPINICSVTSGGCSSFKPEGNCTGRVAVAYSCTAALFKFVERSPIDRNVFMIMDMSTMNFVRLQQIAYGQISPTGILSIGTEICFRGDKTGCMTIGSWSSTFCEKVN